MASDCPGLGVETLSCAGSAFCPARHTHSWSFTGPMKGPGFSLLACSPQWPSPHPHRPLFLLTRRNFSSPPKFSRLASHPSGLPTFRPHPGHITIPALPWKSQGIPSPSSHSPRTFLVSCQPEPLAPPHPPRLCSRANSCGAADPGVGVRPAQLQGASCLSGPRSLAAAPGSLTSQGMGGQGGTGVQGRGGFEVSR